MTYTEFHASTYGGATPDASASRGYACPNDPAYRQCYGYTGMQVLDSFHALFATVSSEDNVVADALMCLAISGAWKLIFMAIAFSKCRGGIAVKATTQRLQRVEPADAPKL